MPVNIRPTRLFYLFAAGIPAAALGLSALDLESTRTGIRDLVDDTAEMMVRNGTPEELRAVCTNTASTLEQAMKDSGINRRIPSRYSEPNEHNANGTCTIELGHKYTVSFYDISYVLDEEGRSNFVQKVVSRLPTEDVYKMRDALTRPPQP